MTLQNLNFPLDFTFRLSTLASDFIIKDAQGNEVAYVRQKMFKLKEEVIVYNNKQKDKAIFSIKANKWIDFNASYEIKKLFDSKVLGKISRRGMRSIWKSTYEISDEQNQTRFKVTEDNAWTKFLDGLVGEIPVIGMFTGYFLNPSYTVKDEQGNAYYQLKKQPSFFGRRFQLVKKNHEISPSEESLVVLSLLMMVLLERARG